MQKLWLVLGGKVTAYYPPYLPRAETLATSREINQKEENNDRI